MLLVVKKKDYIRDNAGYLRCWNLQIMIPAWAEPLCLLLDGCSTISILLVFKIETKKLAKKAHCDNMTAVSLILKVLTFIHQEMSIKNTPIPTASRWKYFYISHVGRLVGNHFHNCKNHYWDHYTEYKQYLYLQAMIKFTHIMGSIIY